MKKHTLIGAAVANMLHSAAGVSVEKKEEPRMTREQFEQAMKDKVQETRLGDFIDKWVHLCAATLKGLGVSHERALGVAQAVFEAQVLPVGRDVTQWPKPGDAAVAHIQANPDELDTPPA